MNTRLCNATLRITTDYHGNSKPEIVLSYVTQRGGDIERDKRCIKLRDMRDGFDPSLGGTAEVSRHQNNAIFVMLDVVRGLLGECV